MPSSSIKLHPSMSPWVLSRVKNKWAMSTRRSANRNQVGLDTVLSSCASSCCILEPGMTSWEQRQGQANHYLQLITSWISHTLKFLLSLFLSNCFCLLLILSASSLEQGFPTIYSVWRKAGVSRDQPSKLHSSGDKCWLHRHVEQRFPLPREWFVVPELSPSVRSQWMRDSSSYSTTVRDSFPEHNSAPTCLSAVPQLLRFCPN